MPFILKLVICVAEQIFDDSIVTFVNLVRGMFLYSFPNQQFVTQMKSLKNSNFSGFFSYFICSDTPTFMEDTEKPTNITTVSP